MSASHDTIDRLRSLVAATTTLVRVELEALNEDGASFHRAPGEWCAKEVVGHLIEADRRGFSGRLRIMLGEDRARLQNWDQEAVAAGRGDCAKPRQAIVGEFIEVRSSGLSLLDEITPDDLDRVAMHPVVGELRRGDVLHEWPYHDRDHLKQLLENTRQLLWPDMGATQDFSEF